MIIKINNINNKVSEFASIEKFTNKLRSGESIFLIEDDGDIYMITKIGESFVSYSINDTFRINRISNEQEFMTIMYNRKFKEFLGEIIINQNPVLTVPKFK